MLLRCMLSFDPLGTVGSFQWSTEAHTCFEKIKQIISTSVLALPDFSKVFQVDRDASSLGVSTVLRQEWRSIAFFSENLMGDKNKYSTYDAELYAVVRAFRLYLVHREFVLFTDYETIHGQDKLNNWHVKRVNLLQEYHFLLKHKSRVLNRVADALSWKVCIRTTSRVQVLGFY